jgi:NitT/TauT family transport system substrate-binding protein
MRLRIAENFEALFYAPLYALQAGGFAQQENLTIDWLPPGSPGGAIDAVRAGEVDLTWGGPMRVLRDRDRLPDDDACLICVGEVVRRDPFLLMMRAENAARRGTQISMPGLAALRLSVVSEVPTPWLCLQQDLRDAGIDPADMVAGGRVARGLSMTDQIDALHGGAVDVIQLFEPHVSQLERDGFASVVYAASTRGACCYTTFITARRTLARHRQPVAALQRALGRAQQWIATEGPDALAQCIAPRFPGVSLDVLRAAASRYVSSGVWSTSPQVSRQGVDRLRESLLAGGFVQQAAAFDSIVTSL